MNQNHRLLHFPMTWRRRISITQIFILPLLLGCCHIHGSVVSAWSISTTSSNAPSVRLPFIASTDQSYWPCSMLEKAEVDAFFRSAFLEIVDSSAFLIRTPNTGDENATRREDTKTIENENVILASCSIPAFGDDAQVHLVRLQETDYALSAVNVSEQDFGWICTKFYESRSSFGGRVNTQLLRIVVARHHSSLRPHPGYCAASVKAAASQQIQTIYANNPQFLNDLQEKGYVVLDTDCKTWSWQHEKLSTYLVEKTGQDPTVRSDTVHFLTRHDAIQSGMQEQFDLLMGMASFFNTHLESHQFRASPYEPLSPGTRENPLTLPRSVQLAEYGYGDFYIAHSDNSFDNDDDDDNHHNNSDSKRSDGLKGTSTTMQRRNFRYYTCILYLNQNWCSESDGGALRLYPGTRDLMRPAHAPEYQYPFVDIVPANGRLILFDSCLVHSVEQVTSKEKTRRALTLWILRPEQNGVRGEIYY